MHDSMMIAEVGDIEKVSGSRIATPLAPPSPGSTPTMTPSRMPMHISRILYGCRTTAKPWNRLTISSIRRFPDRVPPRPAALVLVLRSLCSKPEPVLDRSLGQRYEEPLLEREVGRNDDQRRESDCGQRAIAAQPHHEDGDQEERGDVDSRPRDDRDVERGGDHDRQHLAKLAPVGEPLVGRPARRVEQVDGACADNEDAEIERKETRLRPLRAPADSDVQAAQHDDDT